MSVPSVKCLVVLLLPLLEAVTGDNESCQDSPDEVGLLQVRSSTCTITSPMSGPASTTQISGVVELGYHGGYGAVAVVFPRFGSPESQQVVACFDTGSSATWTQLSTCRKCESTKGYPTASLEYVCSGVTPCIPGLGSYAHGGADQCFSAFYGPGAGLAGFGIQAMVALGNNSYLSNIGAVQYYGQLFTRNDVGGIVGVSPETSAIPFSEGWVETNDVASQRAAKGYFSMCLPQCEPGSPGVGSCFPPSYERGPGAYRGFACFGCEDACSIPGSGGEWVTTRAIEAKIYGAFNWGLPLQGMAAVGREATRAYAGSVFGAVVVDSGTALIQLSLGYRMFETVFEDMASVMTNCPKCCTMHYFDEPTVQTEKAARLQCAGLSLEDWPKFSVTFGGVNLQIDPKYFVTVNGEETSWTVQIGDSSVVSVILGAVFFNQFYMKFSGLGESSFTDLRIAFRGVGAAYAE